MDNEYDYSDYLQSSEAAVFKAALDLVLVATAVGLLQNVTSIPRNDSSFGFNIDAIASAHSRGFLGGELGVLLGSLLSEGASHKQLLGSAALLWGGAGEAPCGFASVEDRVIGIVAPQCTVLLDFVRDPIRLAVHGIKTKFLSVHHGATPMPARDPANGFVMAARTYIAKEHRAHHSTILRSERQNTSVGEPDDNIV